MWREYRIKYLTGKEGFLQLSKEKVALLNARLPHVSHRFICQLGNDRWIEGNRRYHYDRCDENKRPGIRTNITVFCSDLQGIVQYNVIDIEFYLTVLILGQHQVALHHSWPIYKTLQNVERSRYHSSSSSQLNTRSGLTANWSSRHLGERTPPHNNCR